MVCESALLGNLRVGPEDDIFERLQQSYPAIVNKLRAETPIIQGLEAIEDAINIDPLILGNAGRRRQVAIVDSNDLEALRLKEHPGCSGDRITKLI